MVDNPHLIRKERQERRKTILILLRPSCPAISPKETSRLAALSSPLLSSRLLLGSIVYADICQS